MDEIDLIILKKLNENSRLTIRELAEITDISVSAIHKRIKILEDKGNICGYIARPSIIALKCLWVMIFGTSNAKSMDAVSKELGQHESVMFIAITGGKFLLISGFLRDITELQEYSSYVSKTAQMSEPTIAIYDVRYKTVPEPLSRIDFKILKTLNKDARKPITEIADDVGVSTKTIRKRLDHMIENNLADFSIQITPHMNSFVTIFHLFLKEGTNITSTLEYLGEKYSKNLFYYVSFSNIPNLIQLNVWTKSPQDAQKIQEELQKEGFKDMIPHIVLSVQWYDCWIDQLLRTK
ncbi:MAG: AsnC family transcriptional regulator [Candidatus Lokiarchaeota archaeon]|nr:AsnC family transcriptional regulator [Candidatus Lokiarchaeota archaeon]